MSNEANEASRSSTTHDGEIDGPEQDVTSPDRTGTDIDASGTSEHDEGTPTTSEDQARAHAARKQADADDLPT